MNTKAIRLMGAAAIAVAFVLSGQVLAKDYGVFVDGSYSPGKADSEMDRVVDSRIDEAKRIFDARHNDPDDESQRVDTMDALEAALNNMQCQCGDTITIVMMGHGKKNSFKFTKERKSLSARKLLDLLDSATIACCCKIHVVIFSCHSGSFIDDLFKDAHVESVYTSCLPGEVSRSSQEWEDGQFTDHGDWMRGFNEDWEAAAADASVADALEEASKTAEEKMPPGGTRRQHPQGWRRGELPVLAHVERVCKRGGQIYKMKVHFYNPEFLRCTQKWVKFEQGVDAPDDLRHCEWVRFQGRFGKPGDDITASGDITRATAPAEHILAHVQGVNRTSGTVTVHTIEPTWMYCTSRTMRVEPPGVIGPDVQFCKWIEQDVTVDDPDGGISTTDDVTPTDQTFRVKAHVEGGKNLEQGTVRVHLLEPRFLYCQRPTIQLPSSERYKLQSLTTCNNIWVNYATDENPYGYHDVSGVRKITSQGSPTHYYYFDAGIDSVLEPGYSLEVRTTVNPELLIRNVGQQALGEFVAACMIQWEGIDVYADFQEVAALDPGASVNIIFEGWTPQETGSHTVAFDLYVEDENPWNNRIGIETVVTPPETWPTAGDATLDGKVNILDLIFIRNRLREDPTSGDNWQADVNGDGAINILDLIFTRNRLGNDAETTPPFTRDYMWNQITMLELPPEIGGPQVTDMHGYLTWGFEPSEAPGEAMMVLEDMTGTGTPLVLQVDVNGDGIPEPVETGPIEFDIYDVDTDESGGTIDLETGEFSFVTVIVPRTPLLEEMGIDLCPDPIIMIETGIVDFSAGLFELTGTFAIQMGPLAGTTAVCSKGGSETETKKLSSRKYYVDVRASFTLLWLKNLGIPDGKVKVKVKVIRNGKEVVVEGELEIKDGKSTTGLKIAGIGQAVTKVKSVEITYEK